MPEAYDGCINSCPGEEACGQENNCCDTPCAAKICRRDFLKMALAASMLVGCRSRLQPSPTPTSEPTVTPQPTPSAYWPTDEWRISTPEEQGVDSELLVRMLEFVLEQNQMFPGIQSLLVTRNNYIVLEAHFHPAERNTKWRLGCATRSITSALMGIAIEEGYVSGVDQRLLDLFPEQTPADGDPSKDTITLAHLLTNTSGLGRTRDGSTDWIQRALDARLMGNPGSTFHWARPDPQFLVAILQATTGTDILSFAQEHLFGPLGISDVVWESDSADIPGSTALQLTPRDLAKFGLLYSNSGIWDEQQVVPEKWVTASYERYTKTMCGLGFGYQWWIHSFGAYAAQSPASQCYVMPDLDMVVVSTSEARGGPRQIAALVESFITQAAKSPKPLPENPDMVA